MRMRCFHVNDATDALETLYDAIMLERNKSRVGTMAIKDVMVRIADPSRRVITAPWRRFNPNYAEREWRWYLSGDRSVEEIKRYAPIWDRMHGGDNIVNSNYGWQWNRNGQLDKCIKQLKSDRDTRQAWLTIFDGKEKDDYAHDTPCTLSVGFDAADGCLDMTVLMRSCDLIFGFCNDQYCWTKLQETVAGELGLPMGTYMHYAHDMHLYERHWFMKQKFYGTNDEEKR